MKKALIVSPYLDHLGGGERYMLSVASVLESLNYQVYFAWDNLEEVNRLAQMLGINLSNPQLDPGVKPLYFGSNPLKMYQATRGYETVVYLSDGSLPMLGGKCNIVHMQVPFHGVNGKSWKNQLKKRFIDHVIVNSEFTKRIVDREYGINSKIVYPPVKPIEFKAPKENIILSVGRFEPSLNAKKQDILIQAWRALSPSLPGWKLVLAGASSSDKWVGELKQIAAGFPVEFAVNVSHTELTNLYAKATLYWHAAGYGIDEVKNPELTEHFGISTVEAVSAGCIPLIVPYGGQAEIVKSPDLHWSTKEELISKTLAVINHPDKNSYLNDIKFDHYTEASFAESLGRLVI
jgi:glycosyltransferase involved in cell wall biosynthesis